MGCRAKIGDAPSDWIPRQVFPNADLQAMSQRSITINSRNKQAVQGQSGNWAAGWLVVAVLLSLNLPGNVLLAQGPAQLLKENVEPAEEPPKPTLKQRLEQTQSRLAKAQARLQQAEADDDQQIEKNLKSEIKLLSRLESTLTQLRTANDLSIQLKEEHNKVDAELAVLLRDGLQDDHETSFLDFDALRDELRLEQRRVSRQSQKAEAAAVALVAAREDLNEKQKARRLALEVLESNEDALLVDSLEQDAIESELQRDLAQATADLHGQEAATANQVLAVRELHVKLLEEKTQRLRSVVRFSDADLRQQLAAIGQKEAALRRAINEVKNDPNLQYFEQLWIRARQKADASTGDTSLLDEEAKAHVEGHRALQEKLASLQESLDRLAEQRVLWKRRQQLFNGRPERKIVGDWTVEAEEILERLGQDEHVQTLDLDDLRTLQDQLAEQSETQWTKRRKESADSLLETYQQNLTSIRENKQLQEKLLREMQSDSLATTARDQLAQVWSKIVATWNLEIITFGETGVTIAEVIKAMLVLLAGLVFSRALSRSLGRQVLRRMDIDPSASATIQALFYYLLLLLCATLALKVVNVPLTALTFLGGALALGVGFGSQNVINNFLSGLILLAERPVKVGDLIQLDELYGNVEHIGARSTRVRTGSNLEIIVPNSSFLQNNVINFTLSSDKVRTMVGVGVVYGSPTVTVTQLLRRAVVETGRVAKDPPPIILFTGFGDNSLTFEIHFWIRMRTVMDRLQVESAVRYRIDQLFHEEGIVIAFPQRDVHIDSVAPLEVRMVNSPDETKAEEK